LTTCSPSGDDIKKVKDDLQLKADNGQLQLNLVQHCESKSLFSASSFFGFLKTHDPLYSFGKPSLHKLALVKTADLKEEAFFKCGETHHVHLEEDARVFLKKCARFMELRGEKFNPALAPVKGEFEPNFFLYFPSEDRGDFLNYYEKLSEREKKACIVHGETSFF